MSITLEEMLKTLHHDQFIELQLRNDLLQTLVFFLERFSFQKPADEKVLKSLAPVIVTLFGSPSFATHTHTVQTKIQMNINLA